MNNQVNDKKPKNVIVKEAMILFVITLVAGLVLSVVYGVTSPIIEERALDEKRESYQIVFAQGQNFRPDDNLSIKAETAPEELFQPNGLENITIDEILVVEDSTGNSIGHALSVTTSNGYSGDITLSLGYSLDGVFQGIEFLVLNETVGFGQNAQNPEFKEQFVGRQVTGFVSTKSGASQNDGIDGISGATITTDAITDAVNAGILFINEIAIADN